MSSTRLDRSGVFSAPAETSDLTSLNLDLESIKFCNNGIVFKHVAALQPWTEMTVELRSPWDGQLIRCTGIVVACNGNPAFGFSVSMIFLNLTPQSQHRLAKLAFYASA